MTGVQTCALPISADRDDTRTFNDANELLTRDTDSNASVNYTLVYNKDGELTDDNKDYKYVYDGFGRLRKIKKTSNSDLVEEFWYNGLGFRIAWKYDTDTDGDVDGSDKKFHLAYDERWRSFSHE